MSRPPLPCPEGLDLTRPLPELAEEAGVSVPTVRRWRREAGVSVPRGAPVQPKSVGRTRIAVLDAAGAGTVRNLRHGEGVKAGAHVGVSRQAIHHAWRNGRTDDTLARWAAQCAVNRTVLGGPPLVDAGRGES